MGGHLFSCVVGMVCSIVQARYVTPSLLGQLQSYAIFTSYLTFLHLGTSTALQRELPYYIARGQRNEAEDLASVGQGWALLAGGSCACVFLLFSIAASLRGDYACAAGWLVQAISIFATLYTGYLAITFRTSTEFITLAKSDTLNGLAAIASLPLLAMHPYYGLCARSVIPSIAAGTFLHAKRPLRVRISWNWPIFHSLIAFGLPLTVFGYVETSFWSATQNYLVLQKLGMAALGLLGFTMAAQYAMLVPAQSINQIYMPRIAAQFGRTGKLRDVIKLSLRPTLASCLLMSLFAGITWFVIPPVVRLAVPRYARAIPALQWSVLLMPITALRLPQYILIASRDTSGYAISVVSGFVAGLLLLLLALRSTCCGLSLVIMSFAAGKLVMIMSSYAAIAYAVRRELDGVSESI